MGVSQEQVQEQLELVNQGKAALTDKTASITMSLDQIAEIIEILKVCWNTTGGQEEQSKLKQMTEEGLDPTKIMNQIEAIKNMQITATTHEVRVSI